MADRIRRALCRNLFYSAFFGTRPGRKNLGISLMNRTTQPASHRVPAGCGIWEKSSAKSSAKRANGSPLPPRSTNWKGNPFAIRSLAVLIHSGCRHIRIYIYIYIYIYICISVSVFRRAAGRVVLGRHPLPQIFSPILQYPMWSATMSCNGNGAFWSAKL